MHGLQGADGEKQTPFLKPAVISAYSDKQDGSRWELY